MRTLYFHAVTSAIILVAFSGAAQATTLATTTEALSGFQGSQSYQATVALNTLDAEVEYAVFAPGNFQSFLDENGILTADPAPGEYTYAYQIVDVPAGTSSVTNLSVAMQGDEAAGSSGVTFIGRAVDYGTYALSPDVDPGATGGGPGVSTSAVWAFLPGIPPGQISGILHYSSTQQPEFGFSTMAAGIATEAIANSLPNPVPEPSTLLLASVLGLISCLTRGGHRNKV